MKAKYKFGILGGLFLIALLQILLATSVIKWPFTGMTDSVRDEWDCKLSFNSDEHVVQIQRTHVSKVQQTVLEMIVSSDRTFKDEWKIDINPAGMILSHDQSTIVIKKRALKNPVCYDVISSTRGPASSSLNHCIKFGSHWWYGGAERYQQRWPINALHLDNVDVKEPQEGIKFYPFISHHFRKLHEAPGSVLERYWLSSSGVAIFVDREVPLFVGYDPSHLCLKSAPLDQEKVKEVQLRFTVCVGNNVKTIHQFMANSYWPNPSGTPDELMIKYPIWATWVLYKKIVNQSSVISFAQDIKKHKFPISHIEIDDRFSTHYGDFDFDAKKFSNPKEMIRILHDMGCRVTAWILPFMHEKSVNFGLAKQLGYLVFKDETRREPLRAFMWGGYGGLVDFTNKAATQWYFERRKALDQLGMDSYKYDGGESGFLTQHFVTHTPIKDPNEYSTFYVTAAAAFTDRAIEVRVGYKTQHLPIFVRIMDMNSVWSGGRGLDVLIPTVLHFGLIGYPFILPDLIGGNGYKKVSPDKELFIRWTQVTAFLPSMQFSYVPWLYDQEAIDICRDVVMLHVDYVTPLIYKWARIAVETGDPIIRPLWWIAPDDEKTYNESSTFLIGKDVLVAPIISKGSTKRDIYLPKGTWKDMLRKNIIQGPITLRDYGIALAEIAYFEYV